MLFDENTNWEELTAAQNEALLTECFQAGMAWKGKILPPTYILPCGYKMCVAKAFKTEYNAMFVQGWRLAKSINDGIPSKPVKGKILPLFG